MLILVQQCSTHVQLQPATTFSIQPGVPPLTPQAALLLHQLKAETC